ncbi:MAG: hypothetical protein EOP05_12110, partial [Proteobacteria bacterium]
MQPWFKRALALLIFSFTTSSLVSTVTVREAMADVPGRTPTPADIESANNIHAIMLQHEDTLQYGLSAKRRVYGETQLELMKIALFDRPNDVVIKSVTLASKDKIAQALIDSAAKKIFTSSTALESFCPYAGNKKLIVANFGVSPKAASGIAKACSDFRSTLSTRPNIYGGAAKASRSVVLVELAELGPVESWTSAKGNIHIFHAGRISEFELLQRLLHEYYVGFDKYWLLGSKNVESFLAEENLFSTGMNGASQVFFNGMSYPLMKGTFLLARSYEFETRVFNDLLSLKPDSNSSLETDCWERARAIGETIVQRQDLFSDFLSQYLSPRNRFRDTLEVKTMAEFDLMQTAERVGASENQYCALLSTPKSGLESVFFTSGPRPRIGSGTQATS